MKKYSPRQQTLSVDGRKVPQGNQESGSQYWERIKALRKHDIVLTCEECGHCDTDVHEVPTYSQVLGRDTTAYLCDDIYHCLKRQDNAQKEGGKHWQGRSKPRWCKQADTAVLNTAKAARL